MSRRAQQGTLLVALGAVAVLLQGCTFGMANENCDGDECSCSLTFNSFWARIVISDVPIEHASRIFNIPDVAKDVPNASAAPCCNAMFDQIDYDEGKSPSAPNKTLDSFKTSCASSPNSYVSNAATQQQPSEAKSTAVARRLHGLRKAPAPWQQAAHPDKQLEDYEPIHDGEEGQDCEITTNSGFPLNNVNIATGSMKLTIKWVDPEESSTPCCIALKPILENVYLKGMPEKELSSDTKKEFCNSCKKSPNQGIALAAYRCFGGDKDAEIDV